MGDRTGIEWADSTWNPVTGCTKVSPGCDHCYAETLAERFRGAPGHYYEGGFDVQLRPNMLDVPLRWTRPRRVFVNSMSDLFHEAIPDEYIAAVFAVMGLATEHTFQLLTKRHGRMRSLLSSPAFRIRVLDVAYLMCMGEYGVRVLDAPDGGLALVGDRTPIVVPKRLAAPYAVRRAAALAGDLDSALTWPLPNLHVGVSVEDQKRADLRIPALIETPAAFRFLSCEPLLGPVDLHMALSQYTLGLNLDDCHACAMAVDLHDGGGYNIGTHECPFNTTGQRPIDWVIVGGESGRGARPMHPDWARSLRDQCDAGGVPFLFKQWGEWAPHGHGARANVTPGQEVTFESERLHYFPTPAADDPRLTHTVMWRVGKRKAGRLLDGVTHDGYPTELVDA